MSRQGHLLSLLHQQMLERPVPLHSTGLKMGTIPCVRSKFTGVKRGINAIGEKQIQRLLKKL